MKTAGRTAGEGREPRGAGAGAGGDRSEGQRFDNTKLLVELTDDKELGVRRRACQAIAACMQREDAAVAKTVEKLDHLMVFDRSGRRAAGSDPGDRGHRCAADVPRLEKALHTNQSDKPAGNRTGDQDALSERI